MTQDEQLRRIGQQTLALGFAHAVMILVKPGGQVTILADHKQGLTAEQSAQFVGSLLELSVKQVAPRPRLHAIESDPE